jgi:aminopeptidase
MLARMRPEFAAGARNAVQTCLGIGPRDRVAVIKNRDSLDVAEAVEEEVLSTGAELRSWLMEDVVGRPATAFPRSLGEEILGFAPTASYFIGGGLPGELGFRQPLLELLTERLRCRHGHMIGIDAELMTDGMAVDYDEVYRVTRRVWEIVRDATRIEVATALGTELVATFSPDRRWVPSDGRYHEQGLWGNLPEGETFTAPLSLDGLLVGEEMGDHFTERYGLFREPVRIRVKDGRVAAVEAPGDPVLKDEIERYLAQHPNSSRAGEFAIGTNVGLRRIVGNFLQDEKFPGVHVAFGDPYGFETGADWHCPSHVDVLASHADVSVDGRKIMEGGRFLV